MRRWDPPAAHYIALHTTGLCNLGPQEKYWAMTPTCVTSSSAVRQQHSTVFDPSSRGTYFHWSAFQYVSATAFKPLTM